MFAALLVGALPLTLPGPAFLWLLIGEALVVGAVVLDLRAAPHPRTLRLSRHAPEVATVGEDADIAVEVTNPGRWPLEVHVHDATPPSLGRSPRRHRVVLAAGNRRTLVASVRPTQRGDRHLGPVTVRAFGPLRLAARQADLELPGRVRVHPPLPGRRAALLRLRRDRLLTAGERPTRQLGGGGEFDSLRDYHRDDEFRRINWRATARAGRPISNVYRDQRNQRVALLLDCGRTMAGNVAGRARVELAIDGAVAVAELATRIGDQVGTLAFDREVRASLPARTGRAQVRRILDVLFDLEPRLDASRYPNAFAELLARHRRRTLLILLTELSDPAAMEPLLRAVPVLLSRHLLVVGSVRDPEIERRTLATPTTSEQVYAAAAAALTIARRDDAARGLRRLGATVIDATPDAFAGALVDAYLRIKDRGAL